MRNADVCCGGAGTHSMKNRGVSVAHFRRVKGPCARNFGADSVACSCPACHIQFRRRLDEAYALGEARAG